MEITRTIAEIRHLVAGWQQKGERVALVPTMGFLHAGHLSLITAARSCADRVVVSIYVNPTQFAPNEDLATYPRDWERDEAACRDNGVDAVFYPDNSCMYATDHSTWVTEGELSAVMCGQSRPTHFRGVTTVVLKLFNIVGCQVAVFGRKDAQQVLIIERMVRDLNIPVEIIASPLVRETDGLALSSRNQYLTAPERERALCLNAGLQQAAAAFAAGERAAERLLQLVQKPIAAGADRIDYIELMDRGTLRPVTTVSAPAVLAVAAFFGGTRLIDNVWLDP